MVSLAVKAQVQQHVRGKVTDQQNGQPISDANVVLEGGESVNAKTSANGEYDFQVSPGRYRLTVSHVSYNLIVLEVLVIAGKQSVQNISLTPTTVELGEVTVGSSLTPQLISGQRSLSIEKALRIPANFFDPVRVATSYPGVIAANDQGNSIIVRGNSPNGLLWRLNGLNIVNPNHLANAGTFSDRPIANGGGVNMLSAQMLGQTDFYTGAIPSSYGNSLSGVIDMELRDGNRNEREYTAQASLIGLDLAAEGPMGTSGNSSFLANYRYSTVGLLSKLGMDFGGEIINFQDLSFHTSTDIGEAGKLSFFGFGGLSSNEFDSPPMEEWEEDKDMLNIDYESVSYAVGANYVQPLKNGKLFLAVGYSSSDQERYASLSPLYDPNAVFILSDHFELKNSILSSQLKYATKLSRKIEWELGVMMDYIDNGVSSEKQIGCQLCSSRIWDEKGGDVSGSLLQPFTSFSVAFNESVKLDAGVRYVNFSYNDTDAIEPRGRLTFSSSPKLSFDVGYSLTSQIQSVQVYMSEANSALDLTKSHHLDVGSRSTIGKDMTLDVNLFYQYLFDVPIADPYYSTINLLEEFVFDQLQNDGAGRNYGVDVTVEKQFFGKNYLLVSGSYYESEFRLMNDTWYDSRFAGKFTTSAVYGKEWTRSEKQRTISLNTRVLYFGGLRYDEPPRSMFNESPYVSGGPEFEGKLADYFRVDLRLSFRKDKPKYTRTLSFDIQNLTNQENDGYPVFDSIKGSQFMKKQLGIIPVIAYRIDF